MIPSVHLRQSGMFPNGAVSVFSPFARPPLPFPYFHLSLGPRRAKRNFQRQNAIRDSYVNRFRSTHVERNSPSALTHPRLLCDPNRSRSALTGRIVFPICSNLFSLYAHICSRSTPVDQNAPSVCSNVLSLDARRSKCGSYVPKGALARRHSAWE